MFERARAEGKLVVVDAGIEGCAACRGMREDTYRDRKVIDWLVAHAITVAVDADMQPDVAERFDPWGWPATGILTGDGQTLWMVRGYMPPRRFLAILEEVHADHVAGKPVEVLERAGTAASDLEAACREAVQWIDERGDERGWGGDSRAPDEATIRLSVVRARSFGETDRLERASASARVTARLLDPVWGGVFVASHAPDGSEPIVEKRLYSQAHALASFGLTLAIDPGGPSATAANEVDRYLQTMMRAPSGLYWSTQRDQVPGMPAGMTADAYYKLDDADRRRIGLPVTDHATYTAENGMLAIADLEMFQATGEPLWRDRAQHLLDAVLARRLTDRGYLRQAEFSDEIASDPRLRRTSADAETARYLRPQVQVGYALVQLYEATGDARYLAHAERLAAAIEPLRSTDGGYYAGEPRETDGVMSRRTPGFDNVWAARLLDALHGATGEERYRERASQVLASIRGIPAAARSEGIGGVAVYALALQEHLLGPVEVTLVGPSTAPRTAELFRVGLREPDPRVIVGRDTRRRYPERNQPAAYVCTASTCSRPLTTGADVEKSIAAALRNTARDHCQLTK